jgi:hypothetical protein
VKQLAIGKSRDEGPPVSITPEEHAYYPPHGCDNQNCRGKEVDATHQRHQKATTTDEGAMYIKAGDNQKNDREYY